MRRGRFHERRDDLEPHRDPGRPRAGAAGVSDRGLRRAAGRRLLLGRGPPLGRPRGRGRGHRLGLRPLARPGSERRMRRRGARRRACRAIATRGSRRSRSSPTAARPLPARSTRSASSPTSARRTASGCTSTAPTASPAAATESAGPLFAGLERADSATLDAHKWLGLQKSCSSDPGPRARRAGGRLRPRGGVHAPRLGGPQRGRAHARVLAPAALAEALAGLPHPRRGGVSRVDRAHPGACAPARRLPPRRPRVRADVRADAVDGLLPPRRPAGVTDLDAHNTALADCGAGGRPDLPRLGGRRRDALACASASSTSGPARRTSTSRSRRCASSGPASGGSEPHRHPLDAVEEVRLQPLGLAGRARSSPRA